MELPVSQKQLDDIVYQVAQDYVELKAMGGKIEELDTDTANEVVADVVFIIDAYMAYMNEYMESLRREQINISN